LYLWVSGFPEVLKIQGFSNPETAKLPGNPRNLFLKSGAKVAIEGNYPAPEFF
jgi:hypothetical protein